mmetsp:Transcript_12977/g.36993  ORF Transcript_12977/g.36993 Transcript_12977/m.36993 type:complete len:272 (+) Transcript_12977:633-1448(+)
MAFRLDRTRPRDRHGRRHAPSSHCLAASSAAHGSLRSSRSAHAAAAGSWRRALSATAPGRRHCRRRVLCRQGCRSSSAEREDFSCGGTPGREMRTSAHCGRGLQSAVTIPRGSSKPCLCRPGRHRADARLERSLPLLARRSPEPRGLLWCALSLGACACTTAQDASLMTPPLNGDGLGCRGTCGSTVPEVCLDEHGLLRQGPLPHPASQVCVWSGVQGRILQKAQPVEKLELAAYLWLAGAPPLWLCSRGLRHCHRWCLIAKVQTMDGAEN